MEKLLWFPLGFNFSKTCFFVLCYQNVDKIKGKMMISAKNSEYFKKWVGMLTYIELVYIYAKF